MKKLLVLAVLLVAATTALPKQRPIKIFTDPAPPSRETMDKIDLVLAWRQLVPLKGVKDGFFSVQLIPGSDFTLLLAQSFEGAVIAINAETGETLWRRNVGEPFQSMQLAGFNKKVIFVVRAERLFVLDRDTGEHKLYTVLPEINAPIFGMPLDGPPSAGLAANDNMLFVCLNERLQTYVLPNYKVTPKSKSAQETADKLAPSLPLVAYSHFILDGQELMRPPIPYRNTVTVTSAQGTIAVLDVKGEDPEMKLLYRFNAEGSVDGRPGFDQGVAYIASEDFYLYAVDTNARRVAWRFAGQSAMIQSPRVTDKDVFVKPSRSGMCRLDRMRGEVKWINPEASRFLAVNQRFVYAQDGVDRLLVLDYERGKTLAVWDGARDWVVPVPNEITDRIYMASHDGQIICLRHRANIKPLKVTTFDAPPLPKKVEKKGKADEIAPKVDEPMPDKNEPEKKEVSRSVMTRERDHLSLMGLAYLPGGTYPCGGVTTSKSEPVIARSSSCRIGMRISGATETAQSLPLSATNIP